MSPKEHASSRYMGVTPGAIERCQVLYLSGRDMSDAIPEMSAVKATVIAVESLEADHLLVAPELVFDGSLDGLSDWGLAVAFDILESTAEDPAPRIPKHRLPALADRAARARERILDSATFSPMLWYQDVYFDVGQAYLRRGDTRALDVLTRGLAHELRYHDGRNALGMLRDLAEAHLFLGQADRALAVFAQLLRHAPRDLWTHNVMALRFGHHGLSRLGSEVAQRALELMNADGDPESLRRQITGFLEELQQKASAEPEAEVSPAVLADFREALAGSAASGPARSDVELCSALVPELLEVKVKIPRDLPPPYAGPTVVAYGWESPDFYARWGSGDERDIAEMIGPVLNLFSPQSQFAPAILAFSRNTLLRDEGYVARLKRHYALFREKVDRPRKAAAKTGKSGPRGGR
jgi:hypothetical protein